MAGNSGQRESEQPLTPIQATLLRAIQVQSEHPQDMTFSVMTGHQGKPVSPNEVRRVLPKPEERTPLTAKERRDLDRRRNLANKDAVKRKRHGLDANARPGNIVTRNGARLEKWRGKDKYNNNSGRR